jgi:hypothetical protein
MGSNSENDGAQGGGGKEWDMEVGAVSERLYREAFFAACEYCNIFFVVHVHEDTDVLAASGSAQSEKKFNWASKRGQKAISSHSVFSSIPLMTDPAQLTGYMSDYESFCHYMQKIMSYGHILSVVKEREDPIVRESDFQQVYEAMMTRVFVAIASPQNNAMAVWMPANTSAVRINFSPRKDNTKYLIRAFNSSEPPQWLDQDIRHQSQNAALTTKHPIPSRLNTVFQANWYILSENQNFGSSEELFRTAIRLTWYSYLTYARRSDEISLPEWSDVLSVGTGTTLSCMATHENYPTLLHFRTHTENMESYSSVKEWYTVSTKAQVGTEDDVQKQLQNSVSSILDLTVQPRQVELPTLSASSSASENS